MDTPRFIPENALLLTESNGGAFMKPSVIAGVHICVMASIKTRKACQLAIDYANQIKHLEL